MKKLELKHLSVYLPYSLKVYVPNRHQKIMEMIVCQNNRIDESGAMLAYEGCNDYWFNNEEFKPILKPLNYLTKEIEINGEKFIPIRKLRTENENKYSFSALIDLEYALVTGYKNKYLSQIITYCLPFDVVQKLLEWHFDVFGLIEEGLAVDFYSLEK